MNDKITVGQSNTVTISIPVSDIEKILKNWLHEKSLQDADLKNYIEMITEGTSDISYQYKESVGELKGITFTYTKKL